MFVGLSFPRQAWFSSRIFAGRRYATEREYPFPRISFFSGKKEIPGIFTAVLFEIESFSSIAEAYFSLPSLRSFSTSFLLPRRFRVDFLTFSFESLRWL